MGETTTGRRRMLTASALQEPDSVPVAPDISAMVPVRLAGRPFFDALLLDNLQGGYDTTRYLLELGHRRVACITGAASPSRSVERVRGYERALQEAGISLHPPLVLAGDWTYQSGQAAARRLSPAPSPPTAIFACNDAMAMGVLASLHEIGLKVPRDVSVIGYDNLALSTFTWPPLTTMATPITEVGQCLCEMLLARINGEAPSEPQRVIVRTELLARGSTAPPGGGQ